MIDDPVRGQPAQPIDQQRCEVLRLLFGVLAAGPRRCGRPSPQFCRFAVLAVAWTLADLAGRTSPGVEQVGTALSFRQDGGAR